MPLHRPPRPVRRDPNPWPLPGWTRGARRFPAPNASRSRQEGPRSGIIAAPWDALEGLQRGALGGTATKNRLLAVVKLDMDKAAVLFTAAEAAELADIKPALLKLWLETGKFETESWARSPAMVGTVVTHYFSETDITRLVEFAAKQGKQKPTREEPFVDDGRQENFTVAQVASLWRLSRDTIQRLFQDEPGVVILGDKNPRGKRRRVTLRIPRAVMERVKKHRSNPT